MNTKEKLTEIIGNVVVNDKGNRIRDVFHPEFVQKIVEDLIKHDVKTVVRCKDCKYWTAFYDIPCVLARGDGCCERLAEIHDAARDMTKADHFCSYGERKEGEKDA